MYTSTLRRNCRHATLTTVALLAVPVALLLAAALGADVAGISRRAAVNALHAGELHTLLASGRFGNRVFQNVAVSLLARKFDVAATYDLEAECVELGLALWRGGTRRMTRGPAVPLTDELLRALLEAPGGAAGQSGSSSPPARLPGRLWLTPTDSYFQFPWFARYVRDVVLRGEQHAALRAANPWRDRFGANNDTFVHVRLGDTLRLLGESAARPASVYARAISARGARGGRVIIASDSPTHETVRTLLALVPGAEPLDLGIVQTIQFGATCAHLVLSDGTFSWLVAALAAPTASVRIVPHSERWHGDIAFKEWETF